VVVVDNKMADLTNNKIRPFFHIKNFKDGVEDAILSNGKTPEGRSSEYLEGYDFGKSLLYKSSDNQNNSLPNVDK
jgi:hypothetical protein